MLSSNKTIFLRPTKEAKKTLFSFKIKLALSIKEKRNFVETKHTLWIY